MSYLSEIKARHEVFEHGLKHDIHSFYASPVPIHQDRGWLINRIESLEKDMREATLYASELSLKIVELKATLERVQKDCAFYKCCALSGEVPKEGSEPSAIKENADEC